MRIPFVAFLLSFFLRRIFRARARCCRLFALKAWPPIWRCRRIAHINISYALLTRSMLDASEILALIHQPFHECHLSSWPKVHGIASLFCSYATSKQCHAISAISFLPTISWFIADLAISSFVSCLTYKAWRSSAVLSNFMAVPLRHDRRDKTGRLSRQPWKWAGLLPRLALSARRLAMGECRPSCGSPLVWIWVVVVSS